MSDIEKIEIIAEVMELEAEAIDIEDMLDSYDEWDSLAALSFVAVMDAKYNKTVDVNKLKEVITVQDLMNLI